jgi:hypothetical protein
MYTLRIAFGLVAASALVLLSGCGNPTGNVTGKVTYKGQALKGGNITYVSTEGRASVSGSIKEDGSYTLEKVPAGAVKICVDTSSLKPNNNKNFKYAPPAGQQAPEGFQSGDSEGNAKRYTPIPPMYAKPDTTDLSYTVVAGDQTHDIELK